MPDKMSAKVAATAAVFATLIAVYFVGVWGVFAGMFLLIFLADLRGAIAELIGQRAHGGHYALTMAILLRNTVLFVTVGWFVTFVYHAYKAVQRQNRERIRRRETRETARAATRSATGKASKLATGQ